MVFVRKLICAIKIIKSRRILQTASKGIIIIVEATLISAEYICNVHDNL